jgi:sulfur-carrier protein
MMRIQVRFWSYFRDLAGVSEAVVDVPDKGAVSDVLDAVGAAFPKIAAARGCALVAVGVEYATAQTPLKAGDVVSLFPPVQGG